jgi:hypothetical protein
MEWKYPGQSRRYHIDKIGHYYLICISVFSIGSTTASITFSPDKRPGCLIFYLQSDAFSSKFDLNPPFRDKFGATTIVVAPNLKNHKKNVQIIENQYAEYFYWWHQIFTYSC